MLKLVSPESTKSMLDEIAREGACQMLASALEREAREYCESFADQRDENGHRLVVRNGKGKARSVTTGCGTVAIEAPRVHDRREGARFTSSILPPYMRRSPNVETLLPILYLKGLSTNDFQEALTVILGENASGLSPSAISSLKQAWDEEYSAWTKRPITDEYVYIWADGVNVEVRLGDDKKLCLLVIIGVNRKGEKRLLAVEAGWRESWKLLLDSLVDRGFKAPLVAVGDGALGFWSALRDSDALKSTREQRCWVHKIANVLDCFPKRLQPQVKGLLHDMMYAEKEADAELEKKAFVEAFHAKYPKAVEKLEKDWEQLTTFFSFPAHHWRNLRTTNPIESSFATVKLRTRVTKGAGSVRTAKTMAFKLLLEAEKRWIRLRAPQAIEDLLNGVEYRDGVVVPSGKSHQEATSA